MFLKLLHNQAPQHGKLCGGHKCLRFLPQDEPSKHTTTQENQSLREKMMKQAHVSNQTNVR